MDRYKVLFLDDETEILDSLRRTFRKDDFQVLIASDWKEALVHVQNDEIAVIVSDQRMPGMFGWEVLQEVKKISPRTVRIVLSGYSDPESMLKAINEGSVSQFLSKPWNEETLRKAISRGILKYSLESKVVSLTRETQEKNRELKEAKSKLEVQLDQINSQNVELLELKGKLKNQLEETVEQNQVLEESAEEMKSEMDQQKDSIDELSQKVVEGLKGSVRLINQFSEFHDPKLGTHQKRVTESALKLGRAVNLSDEDLYELELACMLHDIGKIGLPAELAQKETASLTEGERNSLKKHTVIGEKLCKEYFKLDRVAKAVRHHHEYYNGKGYPDGLVGESIPVFSRIITIVDAFDKVMHTGGKYDADHFDDALDFIKENSGVIFDPKLANSFIDLIADRKEEIEVSLAELKPGMVLARTLKSFEGKTLAPKGTVLDGKLIGHIWDWLTQEPLTRSIFIQAVREGSKDKKKETNSIWM